MKVAVFGNGDRDVYKGSRDVKAGWAIIRKSDGIILRSGHSLDRAKAQKTAEGNVQYVYGRDVGVEGHPLTTVPRKPFPMQIPHLTKVAREAGWKGGRVSEALDFIRDHNARYFAEKRSKVRIEVVDLIDE